MAEQNLVDTTSIWTEAGTDEAYEWYRKHDDFKALRDWVDKACLEEQLLQYLDNNYLYLLRNHDFYARLWELELAEWLWLTKLEFIPTNGAGPDFCISVDGTRIWIEAVLTTPGDELIKIREAALKSKGASDYPSLKMTLRYSSSLFTKATKIKKAYIDNGVIGENDLVLIAISGFPPTGALSSGIEHFERAIIPMGHPVVHFSRDGSGLDPNIARETHSSMPSQQKNNGVTVLKQFLYPGDNFPFIDGVLFSEASNLQGLLGASSFRFDESTNVPHIYPNFSSAKSIPTALTDNFYLHKFSESPPLISLETIEPVKKLM